MKFKMLFKESKNLNRLNKNKILKFKMNNKKKIKIIKKNKNKFKK